MPTLRAVSLAIVLAACGDDLPLPPDASTTSPVVAISVTPATGVLTRGISMQLDATATREDGTTIDAASGFVWTSSASPIATVDAGLVTGAGAGAVTITATLDGKSAVAEVTVVDGTLAVGVGNSFEPAAIEFYPLAANGTATPLRSIRGENTRLIEPYSLAVAGQELFVRDRGRILVFPLDGSGDIAPLRELTSSGIELFGGIAIAGDELIVSNNSPDVSVFPLTASGNVAPSRTFTDNAMTVRGLTAIGDEIYVADQAFDQAVKVFPRTATGVSVPTRHIDGSATGLEYPFHVVGTGSELIVANRAMTENPDVRPRITSYALTAAGNVAPVRTLELELHAYVGFMAAHGSELYVSVFRGTGPDNVIAIGSRAAVMVYPIASSGTAAPARILVPSGSETNGIVIF